MLIHFSLCSNISILWTHLADSLPIPTIWKILWTEAELIPMNSAICLALRRHSSKIIQWMASTYSSMLQVFEQPDWWISSMLFLPAWIQQSTSSQLHSNINLLWPKSFYPTGLSGPGSNGNKKDTPYFSEHQNWIFSMVCSLVSYPEALEWWCIVM